MGADGRSEGLLGGPGRDGDRGGERLAEERADGAAVDKLVAALEGHPQSIVLVAGQVGRGVPLSDLGDERP